MELEQLRSAWRAYDAKLDEAVSLNARVARETVLVKADTTLQRLTRGLWVEVVLGLACMLALGSFVAGNVPEPRFFVAGLLLGAYVAGLTIAAVRHLVDVSRIDFDAPVIAIQRELETAKMRRIRTNTWALILGPLMWTPLLVVVAKAFASIDVYGFNYAWLAANLALGCSVIATSIWISKRFANRMQRSALVRRLMDDLAGTSMRKAAAFVAAASAFEEN